MSPPKIVVSDAEWRSLEGQVVRLVWRKYGLHDEGQLVTWGSCVNLATEILGELGFERASATGEMVRRIVDNWELPEYYLSSDRRAELPRPFDQEGA